MGGYVSGWVGVSVGGCVSDGWVCQWVGVSVGVVTTGFSVFGLINQILLQPQ